MNPIAPRIAKVAAKVRMKLQFILLRQFVANFLNLLRIADHESEVFRTIGLQLLAKPFAEETILRIAHTYEQATRWHLEKPPLRAGT